MEDRMETERDVLRERAIKAGHVPEGCCLPGEVILTLAGLEPNVCVGCDKALKCKKEKRQLPPPEGGGLQLSFPEGHRVRQVDNYPASDVASRDDISESSESAGCTEETSLSRTISFINTATLRTGSRGVARVNEDHRHTCSQGLVADKATKLREGPRVQSSPLGAPNPDPREYPLEFFKGDSPGGALSSGYNMLAKTVVHVSGEAFLFARAGFEKTLGRLGTLLLEPLAELAVAIPQSVDLGSRINVTIGIGGDVDDPKIDPKDPHNVFGLGFFSVAGSKQVEDAAEIGEVGFTLPSSQEFSLALPAEKGNGQTTSKGPDGDSALLQTPVQDTVVIGDGAGWLEAALALLVELVGVGGLRNTAHDHLSREVGGSPDLVVELFVESPLAKGLVFPSPIANLVTDSVGLLKRLSQRLGLLSRRGQLDFGCQLHSCIIPQIQDLNNIEKGV